MGRKTAVPTKKPQGKSQGKPRPRKPKPEKSPQERQAKLIAKGEKELGLERLARTGRPPGNPGNSGGKKGRSGRKKDAWKEKMRELLEDPDVEGGLRMALRYPLLTPGYGSLWKAVASYAHGVPKQEVDVNLNQPLVVFDLSEAPPEDAEEHRLDLDTEDELP